MAKYKTPLWKTQTVDAYQWHAGGYVDNPPEDFYKILKRKNGQTYICVNEGLNITRTELIKDEYYVIKNKDGTFNICPSNIFHHNYEKVENA